MTGPWQSGLTVRRMEKGQTPIVDHLCAACGFFRRITGRDKVTDYLRSRPIHDHLTHCTATTKKKAGIST